MTRPASPSTAALPTRAQQQRHHALPQALPRPDPAQPPPPRPVLPTAQPTSLPTPPLPATQQRPAPAPTRLARPRAQAWPRCTRAGRGACAPRIARAPLSSDGKSCAAPAPAGPPRAEAPLQRPLGARAAWRRPPRPARRRRRRAPQGLSRPRLRLHRRRRRCPAPSSVAGARAHAHERAHRPVSAAHGKARTLGEKKKSPDSHGTSRHLPAGRSSGRVNPQAHRCLRTGHGRTPPAGRTSGTGRVTETGLRKSSRRKRRAAVCAAAGAPSSLASAQRGGVLTRPGNASRRRRSSSFRGDGPYLGRCRVALRRGALLERAHQRRRRVGRRRLEAKAQATQPPLARVGHPAARARRAHCTKPGAQMETPTRRDPCSAVLPRRVGHSRSRQHV